MLITHLKFNLAPENIPSQKERILFKTFNHHFSVAYVELPGCIYVYGHFHCLDVFPTADPPDAKATSQALATTQPMATTGAANTNQRRQKEQFARKIDVYINCTSLAISEIERQVEICDVKVYALVLKDQ